MIKSINIKFSVTNIIEYILLMYIIIVSSSVYNHSTNFNLYGSEFVMFFSCILIIIKIVKYKKRIAMIRNLMKSFILMSIFILFYFIMCNYVYSTNELVMITFKFIFFISIMYTYFLGEFVSGNRELSLFDKFSQLVIILSIISLVFWILGSIFKVVDSTNTVYMAWGNGKTIQSYYNIYFETQQTSIGEVSIIKNSSIFTEAPMYSLVVVITLLYELYLASTINIKRIIILLLACLSTFSATGICMSTLFIYIKLMSNKTNNKVLNLLLKCLIPILLLCVIVIIKTMFNIKSGSSSAFCRIDDYRASIKAWKDNLFFGNGIENTSCIINYMNPERLSNIGLSNSLGVLIAQGGIYISAFYIYPCIVIFIKSIIKRKYKIIFFVCGIVTLFILTIFTYNFIILLFLALSYAYIKFTNYARWDDLF